MIDANHVPSSNVMMDGETLQDFVTARSTISIGCHETFELDDQHVNHSTSDDTMSRPGPTHDSHSASMIELR